MNAATVLALAHPTAPAPIHQAPNPLEAVVQAYIAAKAAEDAAVKHRRELEERILALVPVLEEGSQTTKLESGFKVTTTGKLAYKCDDVRALAEACATWPANLVPVKTEMKLDETGCKWLRSNEPEAWATLAKFVTVSPAKTAVKVAV